MNYKKRVQEIRQSFAEKEIDGLLVSQPENRQYLSGFDGSAGYLLISEHSEILATDFRYIEQAKRQAPDFDVFRTIGDAGDWFPKLLAEVSLKRVGFESNDITFAMYRRLTEIFNSARSDIRLVATEGIVEALRAIKDPEEIDLLARAIGISDRAGDHARDIVRPGMSETDLAWEIERFLRENGSETLPFDIIVAAGPNAALPHARPSGRPIRAGEPVLLDFGARYHAYISDLSRTFCAGVPDEMFKKVYDTVLSAQLTAIAMLKPDMTGEEADRIARAVIEESGYGDAFGHGLGHGTGLATHEKPRLGPRSADRLVPGMVFTVEPGIYLPEWGGVRIEDMVVMEKDKVRVLSKARKLEG